MSPFAQASFVGHTSPLVKSHSFRAWISVHTILLNSLSFALLVIVGMTYIITVNNTASKGYAIRDLEMNIHQLSIANQELQSKTQEAKSLQNITHAVKMIGMVKVEQPTYVDAKAPTYAFAK